MFKKIKAKMGRSGQTATELAIFGTLLVFVLGLIIYYALSFNFSQQLSYEAFRRALMLARGNLPTSVIILEDKYTPDISNPLAIAQRREFMGVGSATYSNSLFKDTGLWLDRSRVPTTHMYFKSGAQEKHYSFTLAEFRMHSASLLPDCEAFGRTVNCVRKKITYDDPDFSATNDDKHEFEPGLNPDNASWQWFLIPALDGVIDPYPNLTNTLADVDLDGKEETILGWVASAQCARYRTLQDICGRGTGLPWNIEYLSIGIPGLSYECTRTRVRIDCDDPSQARIPCCGTRCNQIGGSAQQIRNCSVDCLQGIPAPACSTAGPQGERIVTPDLPDDVLSCLISSLEKCFAHKIDKFYVLDQQEGDIDSTLSSKDIADNRVAQGLRPMPVTATAKVRPGSFFRREEDVSKIKTTSVVDLKDSVHRIIQLNCHTPLIDPDIVGDGSPENPYTDAYCPDNGTGKCCVSKGVKDQVALYAADGDFYIEGPGDPRGKQGELHVFSNPEFKKTTVWTTPH